VAKLNAQKALSQAPAVLRKSVESKSSSQLPAVSKKNGDNKVAKKPQQSKKK